MELVENKNVELKREFSTTIFKTISAFSNFDGGSIFIGVDDNGNIIGVNGIKDLKLKIENTINDSIAPRPNIEFITIKENDLDFLELKVYPGIKPPYFYKNISYMRTDTSTVPIDLVSLTNLMLKSENIGFDELDSNKQDLEFKYLEKEFKDRYGLDELTKPSLVTLGLLGNNKYNNAARLLSDNGDFNNSSIDIGKFKLSNDVFEERIILKDNSILKYYYDSLDIFNKHYPIVETVSTPKRIMQEKIPLDAFKESVLNAIIHRDYNINRGVQISMYDYMIEINSPGGLPYGISKDVYISGGTSVPRNRILTSVFFRLGIIEQFGTGIKRIIDRYQSLGDKPFFIIDEYQIKIILPVVNYDFSVLNLEEGIIAYLKSHPYSSRLALETVMKVDKSTMLRKLESMISNNLVHVEGRGPSTTYYIK